MVPVARESRQGLLLSRPQAAASKTETRVALRKPLTARKDRCPHDEARQNKRARTGVPKLSLPITAAQSTTSTLSTTTRTPRPFSGHHPRHYQYP